MSRRQQRAGDLVAAVLFDRLWHELVGLIGTSATAALLRRALKRASARVPQVAAPIVKREGLEYAYSVPPSWSTPSDPDAVRQLRDLVREDLYPLFQELTGFVITDRLARVPELVNAGITGKDEVV